MSEYQYYEFQTVDRPLTQQEMAELRGLSTRARISATRFQNVYHFGDFKGDPMAVIERYFDAFIYVANWGTHELMLRLPAHHLDLQAALPYDIDGSFNIYSRGDVVILAFRSDDEEGGGWIEDDEAASWMPALLPLRAEIAGGDLRALYIGWLSGAAYGMLDDEEMEPPVPAGLGQLSAALKSFVDFLRISDDMLEVAAAASEALPDEPSTDDIERWIRKLPIAEKDGLLTRLATGNDPQIRSEIRRRFRDAHSPHLHASAGTRTVGELLAAAEARAEIRSREAAERKAAEGEQRRREQAKARSQYLIGLVGREDELWQQVEELTNAKRAKEYDQAVELVKDLYDLSVQGAGEGAFKLRLDALRSRCAKRPSFIQRLDRAGLRP